MVTELNAANKCTRLTFYTQKPKENRRLISEGSTVSGNTAAKGGGIISLVDKKQGRELLDLTVDGPANRILALKETHDRMETQHEFYTTGHRLSSEHYEAEVKSEKCADYQKLTLTYYLGNISPITQVITLNNGSGCL